MGGNLLGEFHADHQQVVTAPLGLRQAITDTNIPRVRSILETAEGLLGPDFKFEELYLYPVLERFLGGHGVMWLVREHDGVFQNVGKIAQLAQKDEWSEQDYQSAQESLQLIYEHPISCDGLSLLSLWMERLPSAQHRHLYERLQEIRRQGTRLSEYARERRPA
jgi:hypothetical protein